MNSMSSLIRNSICAIAALFVLSGCVESAHPLSSPEHAYVDKRLEGLWVSAKNTNKGGLYVVYLGHGKYSFLSFEPGSKGIETSQATGFVTHTAKHYYVNETQINSNSPYFMNLLQRKTYFFWEYEFLPNGNLVFSSPDETLFVTAVKQGQLRGKTTSDFSVMLKDTSERILQFIESSKTKVFEKGDLLKKVGN
jgi:hypothetical protein